MSAGVKDKLAVPYGGLYVLNNRTKGLVGRGSDFNMLATNIKAWRLANGLPNGLGVEGEIMAEMCLHYPTECSETDPDLPVGMARLSLEEIVRGTVVLASWKLSGQPAVSEEEAARRAAICSACPLNGPSPSGCAMCSIMQRTVEYAVGNHADPPNSKLGSCRVCRCFLSAAIWVPLEPQWNVLTDQQKKQFRKANALYHCWKFPQ